MITNKIQRKRALRSVLAAGTGIFLACLGLNAFATDAPAPVPIAEGNCSVLGGFDALLAVAPAQVVWVGEIHGTNEMPALFGEMVCAVSAKGPVVVMLERTADEGVFWDAYMESSGSELDRSILLLGKQWSSTIQDGRNSEAILALAETLRGLRQSGRDVRVKLFDGPLAAGEDRDGHMAIAIMDAARSRPDARIMVLSGNFHALKTVPVFYSSPDLKPAAGRAPTGVVLSINLIGGVGGQAWICNNAGCAGAVSSGIPHERGVVESRSAAGEIEQMLSSGYDAVAYVGVPTTASRPALFEALQLIAPVGEAFDQVEKVQAALPAPATDRERLERLGTWDQAGRRAVETIDFASLPTVQQLAGQNAAWTLINGRDVQNQMQLKQMIPAKGWFLRSVVGDAAARAAFLVVQHATNDPDLMRDVLRRMEPLVAAGEVDGQDYALLYDRVSLQFDHQPQRYGTQVKCSAGRWEPDTLEDPDHVEDRRKAVGLAQTEAEYLKVFEGQPCH